MKNVIANNSSSWIKIIREEDGLMIHASPEQLVLSWDNFPMDQQVEYSVQFKWKAVLIKLTVVEYSGHKSNTIKATVEYLDKTYEFGLGRSLIGAGAIGEMPKIISGNNQLKFQFGNNCLSVSDIIIDDQLELGERKIDSNFQLIV